MIVPGGSRGGSRGRPALWGESGLVGIGAGRIRREDGSEERSMKVRGERKKNHNSRFVSPCLASRSFPLPETMSLSLRAGLAQRPPLADTRARAPSSCCGRLAAPNARSQGPARGGFVGGSRFLADDDATLLIVAAAAAASASSFFSSPMEDSKVRVRSVADASGKEKKRSSRGE